jgi:hypothetical protein
VIGGRRFEELATALSKRRHKLLKSQRNGDLSCTATYGQYRFEVRNDSVFGCDVSLRLGRKHYACINNNIIFINFKWVDTQPVALVISYITYERAIEVEYSRFSWGGLHGKHVVACIARKV